MYKKSTWLQDRDGVRKYSDREQDRVIEKSRKKNETKREQDRKMEGR